MHPNYRFMFCPLSFTRIIRSECKQWYYTDVKHFSFIATAKPLRLLFLSTRVDGWYETSHLKQEILQESHRPLSNEFLRCRVYPDSNISSPVSLSSKYLPGCNKDLTFHVPILRCCSRVMTKRASLPLYRAAIELGYHCLT